MIILAVAISAFLAGCAIGALVEFLARSIER